MMIMNEVEHKAFKELEKASVKYKQQGAVWSIQIAQKMIENADEYDADIIKVLKEFVK